MRQVSLFNSRLPFHPSNFAAAVSDEWGNDDLMFGDSDSFFRPDVGDYDFTPRLLTDLELDIQAAELD